MSRRWISLPHMEGRVSRQAHVDLPEGTTERELGREGFAGPATHMYHQHPPTSWTAFEGPLRPRAFETGKLNGSCDCPWDAPTLLRNAHAELRIWTCTSSMDELVRNADGDQLLFVHRGKGHLFCDYGHLAFRDGDYLLLPRSTMWRLEVSQPVTFLSIEAIGGAYQLPERGLLGDHAVFDPGILEPPRLDERFEAQREQPREWRVRVKARGAESIQTFPHSPLDAVGWKGNLSVVRLNWRDIRPVVSVRYHLPPSAHATFIADRLLVCTFCPRPIETDPGALKLPFYHSNDDYDELIFYHRGDFLSRGSIGPGMMTLHPCGFGHGPHPGAMRRSEQGLRSETDEVAVMIDTRDAFHVCEAADEVERPGYVDSWREAGDAEGA